MSSKKIILSAVIIGILAIAGFVFRVRIFNNNGTENPPETVTENPPTPVMPPPPLSQNENSNPPPPAKKPVVSAFPPYSGRDPEEVRPLPDEVKLFSEEQKQKIYAQIQNYGQAVKANPGFLAGWLQGGVFKKAIGDYAGARDMWEYAGIMRPQNSVSFSNLGELYWHYMPDFPKAEMNFKTAIKNKPDDIDSYVSLSGLYYYSYTEKAGLAESVLLDGYKKNLTDINIRKAIADFYERKKDYKNALDWWKKTLELDPNNTDIQAVIKKLEDKTK